MFIYEGSRVYAQILSYTFGSFGIEFLYFLCPGFEENLIFSEECVETKHSETFVFLIAAGQHFLFLLICLNSLPKC